MNQYVLKYKYSKNLRKLEFCYLRRLIRRLALQSCKQRNNKL